MCWGPGQPLLQTTTTSPLETVCVLPTARGASVSLATTAQWAPWNRRCVMRGTTVIHQVIIGIYIHGYGSEVIAISVVQAINNWYTLCPFVKLLKIFMYIHLITVYMYV